MTTGVFSAMECAVARAHREQRRVKARAGMWARIRFYAVVGVAAVPFAQIAGALVGRIVGAR